MKTTISAEIHEQIRERASKVLPDCRQISLPTLDIAVPGGDWVEFDPFKFQGKVLYYHCTFAKVYTEIASMNTSVKCGPMPLLGWKLELVYEVKI